MDFKNCKFVFDHDGTLVNTATVGRPMFSGMESLLEFLNECSKEVYLWTARPRKSALSIMNELDITKYFKDMCCLDDGAFKPDISGLTEMLGAGQNAVLIGDSRADMEGGKNYGAFCIGVLWTTDNPLAKIELQKSGADIVFTDPAELIEFIKNKIEE